MTYLLVAAGGALGATARYVMADLVHRVSSPFFPWGTFVVNVTGCFAFETMELLRAGQVPAALANGVGQVTLGLLAFWAGWTLAHASVGGRA